MPPRSRQQTTSTPTNVSSEQSGTVLLGLSDNRPEGFEVGNRAPSAKYAPVGPDGTADLSKISDKPIKGMGTQLVAEGDTITEATYRLLNPPEDDGLVKAAALEPQGAGQQKPATDDGRPQQ